MLTLENAHIDPEVVESLRTHVSEQVGNVSAANLDAGDTAVMQLEGIAEKDGFIFANLKIVVGDKVPLLRGTPFMKDLIPAARRAKRSFDDASARRPAYLDPDDHERLAVYRELNENFVYRIASMLNVPDMIVAFMKANDIESSLENYTQLMDELLLVWSLITNQNRGYVRGAGGPTEVFVPLVEPDFNGIIRLIDHHQRLQTATRACLERSIT
ncbi:MAG: hypothetical protein Q8P95_05615 [bacterium]|nr:hypothetical protein [bacterium]